MIAEHEHADVQRVDDRAALADAHDERADDRGEAGQAGQHQRQADDGLRRRARRRELVEQQHRRDERDRVGLEQVGRHAGVVADVVADVVGDHGRVARVVLGDAGLDLADQVGADVGALREDAAADAGRRPRSASRRSRGRSGRGSRRVWLDAAGAEDAVVAGDAEQAEPDTRMPVTVPPLNATDIAGDEAAAGRLGGAHVGAHGDVHADEAGRGGQRRADHEAERRRASRRGRGSAAIGRRARRRRPPPCVYCRRRYAAAPSWIAAAIARISSLPCGLGQDPADQREARRAAVAAPQMSAMSTACS